MCELVTHNIPLERRLCYYPQVVCEETEKVINLAQVPRPVGSSVGSLPSRLCPTPSSLLTITHTASSERMMALQHLLGLGLFGAIGGAELSGHGDVGQFFKKNPESITACQIFFCI